MATYTIPQRMKSRRETYLVLYARNEVLLEGEICFETHDSAGAENSPWRWKVGDGTTFWNDLEYEASGTSTTSGTDAFVPTYVASGETWTLPEFKQALFHQTIDVDGSLVIDGSLIEV